MKYHILKRILAVAVCFFIMGSLCGCSPFDSEVSELLSAPKLTGDMQPVQKALEASIQSKHAFMFPTAGEYRSAIIMKDIDSDGIDEGVAFYSTTTDNTINVNIAIVDKVQGEWKVTAQQSLIAGDVEKVIFDDLDSDGRQEIIVGWNIYGDVEKKVCVYEYTGESIISILEESYTAFITCDFNDDFSNDLLIINLNSTSAKSKASCFSVDSKGITEIGNCDLDGSVTSYYEPVVTKTSAGNFCVYVDAVKGAGLITEIICFDNGNLVDPLYNQENPVKSATARTSTVMCQDFDGDGTVEIPLMSPLPIETRYSVNEQAYVTTWCVFDGKELVPKIYSLLNYNDGYYLKLSKEQTEEITVVRETENRRRRVFSYDYEEDDFGPELFSIRTVTKTSFDSGNYSGKGYICLEKNDKLVYLLEVSDYAADYGFGIDEIKKSFCTIKEN